MGDRNALSLGGPEFCLAAECPPVLQTKEQLQSPQRTFGRTPLPTVPGGSLQLQPQHTAPSVLRVLGAVPEAGAVSELGAEVLPRCAPMGASRGLPRPYAQGPLLWVPAVPSLESCSVHRGLAETRVPAPCRVQFRTRVGGNQALGGSRPGSPHLGRARPGARLHAAGSRSSNLRAGHRRTDGRTRPRGRPMGPKGRQAGRPPPAIPRPRSRPPAAPQQA